MPKAQDIIDQVFSPLYGLPCWNARSGYGSFLTMNFGGPYLKISEPRPTKDNVSERLRKMRSRRQVRIWGDWHLWIYCCEWHVFTGEELIGDSDLQGSTKERIQSAADELDGQKLLQVSVTPNAGTSVFKFDLGSRLETQLYDEESEQWMLFEPSGDVFTYGADGRYKHQPGDTPPEKEIWQAFAESKTYSQQTE